MFRNLDLLEGFRYRTARSAGAGWADALELAQNGLGFRPDEAQARVLTTKAQRVIVNCTRQWGKSTVVALRAVWEALAGPERLVLVVSRSERQSWEFVRKTRQFVRRLGIEGRRDPGHRISVALPNGSRIVGAAAVEDTVRCFAVSMLILDEAAKVPDDVYDAVLPMIAATQGSLWLLSTPNGKRGFFWEEWMRGEDWERVSVPATECPRIRAEFLDEMRRKRGDDVVRQEYLCEFVSADDRMFDRDDVDGLFAGDIGALRGEFGSGGGREFYFGVDLGKLADYSAIAVVERIGVEDGFDGVRMERTWRWRNVVRHLEKVRLGTSYPRVVERVRELVEKASEAGEVRVAVDATGLGEPVVDLLRAPGLRGELAAVTITGGGTTVKAGRGWHVPKKELLVGLQGMVARRGIEIAGDLRLREELVEELAGMGRSLRAAGRGHDDLVMAVALAAWRVRVRRRSGGR